MNLRGVHIGRYQSLIIFDSVTEDLEAYRQRVAYQLGIEVGALVLIYQDEAILELIYFRDGDNDEYTVEHYPITTETLTTLIAAITEGDRPVMMDPVPF